MSRLDNRKVRMMCDASVKMNAGYGVFNCQCGFRRSVRYPNTTGTFKYVGTRAEWVSAQLMGIMSKHQDVKAGRLG